MLVRRSRCLSKRERNVFCDLCDGTLESASRKAATFGSEADSLQRIKSMSHQSASNHCRASSKD